MDLTTVEKNLKERGFKVSAFATAKEAADYLNAQIDGESVSFGGSNKIAPTYDEALWRARNIAAPKNAQRLGVKTPCAVNGDRCYDCKSPQRICRGLVVLWEAIRSCETEVVLVDEPLGY